MNAIESVRKTLVRKVITHMQRYVCLFVRKFAQAILQNVQNHLGADARTLKHQVIDLKLYILFCM